MPLQPLIEVALGSVSIRSWSPVPQIACLSPGAFGYPSLLKLDKASSSCGFNAVKISICFSKNYMLYDKFILNYTRP